MATKLQLEKKSKSQCSIAKYNDQRSSFITYFQVARKDVFNVFTTTKQQTFEMVVCYCYTLYAYIEIPHYEYIYTIHSYYVLIKTNFKQNF